MAGKLGLTHIYTGDGKGKTTSAIGLVARAAGHGLKCRVIQFMKGGSVSGEVESLTRLAVDIDRIGANFISPKPIERAEVAASLEPALMAAAAALDANYDLVVLDEIVTAVSLDVLSEAAVLALMRRPGRRAELILTGRGATPALIAAADLVTEMREIKHPYTKGAGPRAGIEF